MLVRANTLLNAVRNSKKLQPQKNLKEKASLPVGREYLVEEQI